MGSDPARIVTLGGECAVSVAPFSELARRYGDDLAIIWIDSHPDIGTPASRYPGFHAMAVAAPTGHGDPQVQELLPAIVSADRVALVGLHAWAIHFDVFDVDTIDSNELVFGLGAEPGGLTTAQARRIVADIDAVTDVVGITVAEFIPRQVMHLQQLLTAFPLLGASRAGSTAGIVGQGSDPTVMGAIQDQAPRSREQ
jgi:arginase